MATVETKEIGISFSVDKGAFNQTEVVEGKLQLQKLDNGDYFAKEGYWESEVIDIAGKFKEYDKIALTKTQFTKDLYKIETRTSSDGIDFNEYIALSAGGVILSTKERYIQIKITLYAGLVEDEIKLAELVSSEEAEQWDSDYIDTSGGLKLKLDYQYDMTKDSSWLEDGALFRQPIQKTKFKKINTISVDSK